MLHVVKSDAVSVGAGVSYVVGDPKEKKSGEVKIVKGKKDGLPVVRRAHFRGLPIDIELDVGMKASGKDDDGTPWEVVYENPYGEIRETEGRDGDPVDIYLGPTCDSELVYVVHQVAKDGKFDEDKVFLGFDCPIKATECYFKHGPKWGFGSLETLTFDQFKNGYLVGARERAKPEAPLVLSPGSKF